MSKRKRGDEDQDPSGRRSKKVRKHKAHQTAPSTENGNSTTAEAAEEPHDLPAEPETARKARRMAKEERRDMRKAQKGAETATNAILDLADPNHDPSSKPVQHGKVVKRRAKRRSFQLDSGSNNIEREASSGNLEKERLSGGPKWKAYDPVGGQMLNLDPIFTHDEQHLLIAYSTFVAVYSTSTSLLIRRLGVQGSGSITGFALDPSKHDRLYITTTSGELSTWEWREGRRLGARKIFSKVYTLAAERPWPNGKGANLIYTISRNEQWSLSAHELAEDGGTTQTNVKTLLKCENRLTGFQSLMGGRLIIATSGQHLMIGTSNFPVPANLSEIKYTWRIVDCPDWIASFDLRVRASERTSKKHIANGGVLEAIDIVIGGLKGTIHIYEDLLQRLVRKEQAGKAGSLENIVSRSLHWHRNVVTTVKWSLDGNYVLSGGQETVLVLWQLETGQKQHLPHLGAPIESIVVSPAGSSYCIRLADNSVMILSTSELRPTFSVGGIQIPAISRPQSGLPFVPTVDTPREHTAHPRRVQYPACVASSGSDRLLLAVPSSSVSNSASSLSQSASYLQTCDISSGHQISRQALTRTKITTLNMGPEANTIEEPSVTHMQISHDSQWLATVDEWTPPKQDIIPLTFDDEAIEQEQMARREIHLKFWSWNNSDQIWQLISRIDNPHSSNLDEAARILALASDPSTVSFATASEAGIVKIWVPTTRMRGELSVKGKDGVPLTSWRCQSTISTSTTLSMTPSSIAKLAYSSDGSLLSVVPTALLAPNPIYLLSISTSEILAIYSSLSYGPILSMGILSKYLLILSHHLLLFDLVTNSIHFDIDLHLQTVSPTLLTSSLLSIDHHQGIFALALPIPAKRSNKPRSKLAIMDPTDPYPLFTTTIPFIITNLVPAKIRRGFYALDANAEIRIYVPQVSVPIDVPTRPQNTALPIRGIDGIFSADQNKDDDDKGSNGKGRGLLRLSKGAMVSGGKPGNEERDAVVVSADKLAEVFDNGGSSLSMPPVTDLFEMVARLYDGRVSG